ncbi:MAG: hypothetical protein P1V35_05155 [Planctomycetota bacterium]|nr:hypothetical protein [Planctomycetota bacterium]
MHSFLWLAPLALALFSCGSSEAVDSPSDGADPGAAVGKEGLITLTIDGVTHSTRGEVRNKGLLFDENRLHLYLLGKRADSEGSLAPQLSLTIQKPTLESGTFILVANESKVLRPKSDMIAFVKLDGEDSLPFMQSVKGTVTFEVLQTSLSDTQPYQVDRVQGILQGTFRSESGSDHEVTGTFEYLR